MGSLIEAERALRPPILLVDAGDALQDFRTPLAAVWGAEEMVDWMSAVGYDAMALGNHEMYWGGERLAALAARASFPILSANLVPAPGSASSMQPAVIREVGGVRVLLMGVITGQHLPFPDFPSLTYVDPVAALDEVLGKFADTADVDLVVAIGHVSVAEASRIAGAVSGIDVFVSGHSHEETPEPIRVGETLIVQSGAFARQLGRLRLDVTDGAATVIDNELLPTETASVKAHADLLAGASRGLLRFAAVMIATAATMLLVLL